MISTDKTIGEKVQDLFLKLGKIDSPSAKEDEMSTIVAAYLDTLNINHHTDELFNIYGIKKGYGDPLFLCAHLDTVMPCIDKQPEFDGEYLFSNGKTILGGDDLVGVCAILVLLELLQDIENHRTIEILFTTQEEIGGAGTKYFLENTTLESTKGLVLDSIFPVGDIVTSAPSKHNFTLKVFGHGQHGSQNNIHAVSAIRKIAKIIHDWPIGQIDENTTLNFGTIQGGDSVNTIPREATVTGSIKIVEGTGELRSIDPTVSEKVIEELHQVVDEADRTLPTVDSMFECTEMRQTYSHDPEDPFILSIKDCFKGIGIDSRTRESRGTSDANTLNEHGLQAILLGTGVENAHTINERVKLSEIVDLTKFLLAFVQKKSTT